MPPRERPEKPFRVFLAELDHDVRGKLAEICYRRGTSLDEIYAPSHGPGNREIKLARAECYEYLHGALSKSIEEIAALFDRTPQAVSRAMFPRREAAIDPRRVRRESELGEIMSRRRPWHSADPSDG